MRSDTDKLPLQRPEALSIVELYNGIEMALARAFPRGRGVWVRGEVQSLSDRTGHCYMDLVDPESAGDRQAPVLKVKCWKTTWTGLKRSLAREGIELAPGMVVVFRGAVDIYRARAEVGLILTDVDVTALLGQLAARRAALLRSLAADGLLERNRRMRLPDVPMRIGLAGSPGSEGYRDFLGQLGQSGFAFDVRVARVTVQGTGAPRAVARAVVALNRSARDLIVVVRGGGSRADLAAFDTEVVARAVAGSSVPVWTGIGHTGDESVADIVANRSFTTPTECGRELAQRVAAWWEGNVVAGAEAVARLARDVQSAAERRDALARGRLASTARHQLRAHQERLSGRTGRLTTCAPATVESEHQRLTSRSYRLVPLARSHVARAGERVESWRRLLAAYDVDRQLERGYTLTTDAAGNVVRSVAVVGPGDELKTRSADGSVTSRVASVPAAKGSSDAGVHEGAEEL